MDEIAAKAGVARSTIYVYFSNRDELLRACLKRMHDQLLMAIAEAWESTAAPMDRLQILLTGVFEQLDDSPAFLRLALSTQESVSQDGVAVGSELALIGLNVAGLLSELVDDGVAAGVFRPIDTDLAITLVGQQIYGAMSVRAAEPLPRPRAEVAAEICDFVVRGLGA
jgi:AcrR family transcriptional regulator